MSDTIDGYTVYGGTTTSPATSGFDPTLGFNVPTTADALVSNNGGTTLDLSAGAAGGTPSSNATGNSLLDNIAQLSALAVTGVAKGLGAYSSFLQSTAVANAANRLNTTPAQITGALPTVPIGSNSVSVVSPQQGMLYIGLAAVAVYFITKHR